ncbi:ABC transporter permease [endosymbiont of unidentified scaly snail isolate Monju]|uniref:ABC transporter permease n=1 Tax=endosymbiont of unidentified scaly snail isolate Monju TaxID=1248727 RepID=UPI0003892750|nr:ABC transporter permease [endosymbiont of unidentified scaly snail isolate Monju]BAN68921.1 tungstate ABC transporter permease [endosymbiont of unidentified scaly snail isolate Monju]
MSALLEATEKALELLISGDEALWQIIAISFKVSGTAMFIATPPAMLIAFVLAYLRFPGRRVLVSLFSTLLSVPAVVVGLTLYLLLSNRGPLGDWRLLFTQSAMVLGQIALAFPILVAMGHAALQSADKRAWETARTLGASPLRAFFVVIRETRFGLLAALLAAYGRIIAEVGASMMLGGNILNYTRNIPTAIALETSKGEFAQGIALGAILLLLAFTLNGLLHYVQGKGVQTS